MLPAGWNRCSAAARKVVCWLLILLTPASTLFADTALGMLSAQGTIRVNGRRSQPRQSVFAGDHLETALSSQATLSLNGALIVMTEKSAITLATDAVQIDFGSTLISTTNRALPARASDLVIVPEAKAPARFLVRDLPDKVEVAALNGTISVHNGDETTQVQAGNSATFDTSGKKDKAGKWPPPKTRPWYQNDDLGITIAVATAVSAGVAVGIRNALDASPH